MEEKYSDYSIKLPFKDNINYFLDRFFEVSFNDREYMRCRFPSYMQRELKKIVTDKFLNWFHELDLNSFKNEDELIMNCLDTIHEDTFLQGINLAKNKEDELTIYFPNCPRIGDEFHNPNTDPDHERMNKIVNRYTTGDEDDWKSLVVEFEHPDENGNLSDEFIFEE